MFLTVVFLVLLARKLRCTQAELAHSRNEQKYLLRIFDLAPLDVLWLDENLVITRVNKTAEQAAGKYHMDLVGMSHHDFDPDFPEEELLSLSTVDTNAKIHRRYPCVQEEPCRSCEEIIYSYGTGAGKVFIRYGFGLVDFVCNKTVERKCITLQSGQAHEVLRSAKRMRMEFIANMNHEIRTPMNAIIGYAEMLAASDLGGREQRFAETIYKSSMTLVSLLNDIMDLSKIESGRLKINQTVISLHHLVRESIVAFEDVARSKNLHLGVEIKKNVPDVILFDGVRLQQILQNLLSNAVKFTHHGSISIAVEASPSGVYQQPEAWTIDITVRDTGLGMDREQELIVSEVLNPVSEESFEVYSGIGFGVPLCAKLTSMMGGRIHLQTEPGKGAAFTVTFDNVLAPATAPQIEQEDKIVPQRRLSSTRIMVVDDMDLIKDVFVDYFNGTEFTVVSASNGDEALAQIKREQPGMIFLDLNLVGKDGNAVARELRANPDTEGIPIILMTGNLLEESEYKPLFDDFLQKPFRLEGLDRIVDKYKKMMERTGNDLVSEQAVIDTSAIKETASLATLWNNDLSYLLDQAMHTGSLSAALMLGNSIVEIGEKSNSETIVRLGEELADAAGEPNIVEVEQILTSLKAMSGYEI
ncbi:histidine kinase dimerization/phospho-acceptor domain-containing protein [Desulfogranum japonicum]|uniref:histidine kinase dimerization/phospho-acceptor domain-containing protein n=1 Tax=Desulfogranum japonicum TaxID=231447 RepID=UPI001294697F|nr:histidine kinase dimerization/phospho-acceptor domain-containing protein [Desulfogranum japonicum]